MSSASYRHAAIAAQLKEANLDGKRIDPSGAPVRQIELCDRRTYTELDQDSVLALNKLTFTSPVDGTTSCSETDQVTLIRISNGMQGNDNSQGNQNQNQQ